MRADGLLTRLDSAGRRRTAKRAHRGEGGAEEADGRRSHKPPDGEAKPARKTKAKPKPKPTAEERQAEAKAEAQGAKPKASSAHRGDGGDAGLPGARGRSRSPSSSRPSRLGLAAAYWFWFRDSSFVAVEKVTVEGHRGPGGSAVTDALTRSGQEMTTLNVDESELAAAVSRYPDSRSRSRRESDFPHGLTIEVTERPPVLTASDGGPASSGGRRTGPLLHGVDASARGLPAIEVESRPAQGQSLRASRSLLAQVAGAAP